MPRRLLRLNLALLAALVAVTIVSMARAWQPAADRPRGEYTLVSGRVNGSTTNAVYIIDSVNQELIALRWDRNNNCFEGMGYRNLAADARGQQMGR